MELGVAQERASGGLSSRGGRWPDIYTKLDHGFWADARIEDIGKIKLPSLM